MKKIILTVIAAAISFYFACSQGCLPEGIVFTTQAQIDNFQTNYPGCTEIIGYVDIFEGIYNLNGLNVLTSIGGWLHIFSNSLSSMTGLDNLTSIGGDLYFSYSTALNSLTGLENLTSIAGNLSFDGNNYLTNLSGLESLNFIGGTLHISNSASITSLLGLESLTTIGGNLWIFYNNALISLSGLESLTSIGGYLEIGVNYNLSSISGLENLTSIGDTLRIENNSVLTSLSGLDNIDAVSINYLFIRYNDLLSTCDVQSICNYLADPNGIIVIHSNAPGCNTPQEVEEHCLTTIEELETGNSITIIPNPSNDKITISLPAITGNTLLSILTISGEKVLERQLTETETQIDISALPQGVYFVRVQDEQMTEVMKLVKQ